MKWYLYNMRCKPFVLLCLLLNFQHNAAKARECGFVDLSPSRCVVNATVEKKFENVYKENVWAHGKTFETDFLDTRHFYTYGDKNRFIKRPSQSGTGSYIGSTEMMSALRFISETVSNYSLTSMLDIPCGDVNWQMESAEIDLIDVYVGADIVQKIVHNAAERFRYHSNKHFIQWDLASCVVPKLSTVYGDKRPFDLIIVKEMLQHIPLKDARQAARHLKRSGARFVIATTWQNVIENRNIEAGEWYPNNLELPPFNFPAATKCVPQGTASICLYNFENLRQEM